MEPEPIVFVVDDDQATRESIAAVIGSKKVRVAAFESAEQFLLHYQNQPLACLLIDVRMPGMTGLELQQRLATSGGYLPTIVFSGHGEVSTAVQAMENGALTFLEKPCHHDTLWQSVERALKLAETHYRSSLEQRDLRNKFSLLSPEERQVLVGVMDGTPNKKIASELDMGLRTVELRRSNIMKKTGANSLSELIRMAIEIGFPNDLIAHAS